jgi:hypothetical protein
MAKKQPYNPVQDLRERERTHQLADYYHHRDAVQFTSVKMETIGFDDARLFTEQVMDADVDTPEILARLVAGIAAIEDHEYRQLCALHAIQAIFLRSEEAEKGMAEFVGGVNAWLGEDEVAQ